jgi:phage terminase large subunit-like protein
MNEEQINKLIKTKEGRRLLSIHSPSFFAVYYMGFDYVAHQERWINECVRLTRLAHERNSKEKLLLLAPRDHGKSYLSILYTVWRLCTDRNSTILFVSATSGQAEKRLRLVKTFLESAIVIDDWASDDLPPFRTPSTKWINTQIYLNRDIESIDPSLEAVGAGGAVTGGHFDVLVLDDVDDDKTTYTAGVRRKTREWLSGTIQPVLTRNGVMLAVGTRKHADDIYAHMIKDATFNLIHDRAIIKMPDSYQFVTEVDGAGRDVIKEITVQGESTVLWQDQRPIEYLLKERATVGSRLFTREFQNEVQDADDAMFKTEWLDAALMRGRSLGLREIPSAVGKLRVIQAWDLALVTDATRAEKNDSDFTVGICWASDEAGHRYLLDITRFRGVSPSELYRRVELFFNKWRQYVTVVAVEKNNFGQLHTLNLKQRSDIPLREHQTTARSKASALTGVPRLTVLFENDKITLPSRDKDDRDTLEPLISELQGYGVEAHDDTVLALSIAEATLQSTSFEYSVSFGDVEIDMWGDTVRDDQRWAQDAENSHLTKLWDSIGLDDEVH